MEALKTYKSYLIFIAIVALLFVGYTIFFKGSAVEDTLISGATGPQNTEALVLGQQILTMLAELKTLELDPAPIRNPLFLNLRDQSVPIDPEPLGRRNPFAPLSAGEAGTNGTVGE